MLVKRILNPPTPDELIRQGKLLDEADRVALANVQPQVVDVTVGKRKASNFEAMRAASKKPQLLSSRGQQLEARRLTLMSLAAAPGLVRSISSPAGSELPTTLPSLPPSEGFSFAEMPSRQLQTRESVDVENEWSQNSSFDSELCDQVAADLPNEQVLPRCVSAPAQLCIPTFCSGVKESRGLAGIAMIAGLVFVDIFWLVELSVRLWCFIARALQENQS